MLQRVAVRSRDVRSWRRQPVRLIHNFTKQSAQHSGMHSEVVWVAWPRGAPDTEKDLQEQAHSVSPKWRASGRINLPRFVTLGSLPRERMREQAILPGVDSLRTWSFGRKCHAQIQPTNRERDGNSRARARDHQSPPRDHSPLM